MGRPAVINRTILLDVAEQIVHARGIASLTIGEVAKAAGISKGGVQSCFGTKDQLINAMFERSFTEYKADIASRVGSYPSSGERLLAHVAATHDIDDTEARRAASMMSAMLSGPDQYRARLRDWYREHMASFDTTTRAGRCDRLAFIATEGAFMLRCFGFLSLEGNAWEAIFADIHQLILEKPPLASRSIAVTDGDAIDINPADNPPDNKKDASC